MIKIEHLSKEFGSKKVLNDINLQFETGNVYGIVGNNGAGKTTLFRCIAGLENHAGNIKSEYVSIKNHIGILETIPSFMSRITGWEYLKLHCIARNIKEDDFENQNIFDLPLNQYAESYSTGMKKKLSLMAILLQKNDVYILDEPFNGVDIQSNIIIVEILKQLKNLNKTIIVSSHIFSTLKDTCDQIILLDEGKVTKCYEPDEFGILEKNLTPQLVNDCVSRLKLE